VLSKFYQVVVQEIYFYDGLRVDGRTILEYILHKQVLLRGVHLIRLKIGVIEEPL
jgi:hypothetical protein